MVRNLLIFNNHKDSKYGVPLLSMINAVDTLCPHTECTMLIGVHRFYVSHRCTKDKSTSLL